MTSLITGLLIAVAAIGITIVAEVAFAFRWVANWLREVVVPWMVALHEEIQELKGKQ
jgi:hypothetical protein